MLQGNERPGTTMKLIDPAKTEEGAAGSGSKKLYLATFGCQMNEYDSQRMIQLLQGDYRLTSTPEDANLILVNTCSIREKAENKVYSLIGRFRRLKEHNPSLVIGVGGCVAQQEGARLLHRLPHLDLAFGPQSLHRLPEMIKAVESGQGPRLETALQKDFIFPVIDQPLPEENPVRAFVTIMQGCDNFCTYCVVPYVRGRETSRPAADVLAEVSRVLEQGVKDVTLLGQNVNSYGKKGGGKTDFAGLLRMVAKLEGLVRLRFTTSHPKDLSEDVMRCFRDIPALCEHLHLPVQSGSTAVLRRMNRRYTREQYLATVDRLRDLCPEITLTTDLIVGFPNESDADFEDTLSLLRRVEYEQIFAFKYSPRPFTMAAAFDGQVAEDVKARRLDAVLQLQNEIGLKRYRRLEGRQVELLVEGLSKGNPDELAGRTRGNHVVNFSGPKTLLRKLVRAKIERACYHSLRGAPVRHNG
jgi:tRNA-2-methylthio-N6-dimethylallyladenosine synthase